jgi:ABC-type multidrug transport system permease subunit
LTRSAVAIADHSVARPVADLSAGAGIRPRQVFEKAGRGDWDRQFGFLKETLVAPVPRIQVMIGRTLGGATTALIQGTLVLSVCLIAGFRPENIGGVLLGFLFMALIAVVFAALGTIIGSALRDMQGFQRIRNFLVMPIVFLCGALHPLAGSSPALEVATHLDPLSYHADSGSHRLPQRQVSGKLGGFRIFTKS